MKNLNSLLIVAVILIGLSCKCQSDLFGLGKNNSANNDGNITVSLDNDNSSGNSPRSLSNANTFADNSPRNSDVSGSGSLANRFPATVGGFRLSKKERGDPVEDGFKMASEVMKAVYNDSANKTVQVGVGKYATAADAEQALRTLLKELDTGDAKASQVEIATDNNNQEIGITATSKGRGNIARLWTSGRYFYLAFGPEAATEKFFTEFDEPLEE